jgi:two-component system, sensor histidine kinase and response regulator
MRNPDELPVIEGLDVKDGLARVAGNRKLYLKLLGQFAEHQGPTVGQVDAALAQGDTGLAERLAHTLKGVAGNIGAKVVQAVAGGLEKLLRSQAPATDIEASKREVAAALDPLVGQLRAALKSSAPAAAACTPAPPADPAQTQEAAAQLAKLLSEFDPGAAEFIEANQAALRALFASEAWQPFAKLVQDYAFADAQARLEQAPKGLPTHEKSL